MKAVVGLGNPGVRYQRTRHNAGFRVVDELIERHRAPTPRGDGRMLRTSFQQGDTQVLVVKPMTYMNHSGEAVEDLVERFGVSGEDLIVVHDDLDLEPGTVRVKVGGGHGGHNGLRSILAIGTAGEFLRVRLGVGRGAVERDAAAWVLEPFDATADGAFQAMVERSAGAVDSLLANGPLQTMNELHRRSCEDVATDPGGASGGGRRHDDELLSR